MIETGATDDAAVAAFADQQVFLGRDTVPLELRKEIALGFPERDQHEIRLTPRTTLRDRDECLRIFSPERANRHALLPVRSTQSPSI
jgi:hypothetical protein